ncbi:uncharacterized protein [Argopecten irradians]
MIMASGQPDHDWEVVNPNTPVDQNYNIPIPKTPTNESTPGCLALGIIGITRTGVALYNPLDAQSENAVEGPGAEVLDSCDGHADPRGVYHYHDLPFNCLYRGDVDEFMGVAMDGYPIYGPKVNDSGVIKTLTSADLDKCHGRFTADGRYRYHMTFTFPYILGCFWGSILYDRTQTQAICSSDTSVWNALFGHYLCNCSTMTGGGDGAPDPACHHTNANKPSYCCDLRPTPRYCTDPNTGTTARPSSSTSRPSITTTRPPSTTARPSSTTAHPPSTTSRPSSTTAHPPSTSANPTSTTTRPTSTTTRTTSTTARPSSTSAHSTDPTQTCFPDCDPNGANTLNQSYAYVYLLLLACCYGILQRLV